MDQAMRWLNPPPEWSYEQGVLRLRTGDKTDFWRETFYGFVRDSGHLYHREVTGDFTARVSFRGAYEALYDQAGLMLRLDADNWIKAGIEYTDGLQHLSVVVTRDASDWSVLPLPEAPQEIDLRLTRHGSAVRVQFSVAGRPWQMVRLAHLPAKDPAMVGMMACSPERSGFDVRFRDFAVGSAIARDLHA